MADVGDVFGDWSLLRLLGKGMFSRVFLARHRIRKTYAALKVLDDWLAGSQASLYLGQKRRLMSLYHPHLVRIFEADVQKGRLFLAMEYAAGGTLHARHPLGERVGLEVILGYLQQIVPGVQYLHEQGLVHGAIRPEKLLLESDGRVVLGDVELPVVLWSGYGSRAMREVLPYLAPERREAGWSIRRGRLEQAADQYSLAAVVYRWIAGRLPVAGVTGSMEVDSSWLPGLREFVPELPEAVEEVVLRALSPDPQKRFEDVGAFLEAFERACRAGQTSPLSGVGASALVRGGDAVSSILLRCQGHVGTITSLAWSPDGKHLASASGDRTVRVWEALTGRQVLTYSGHEAPVLVVAWSPALRQPWLASGGVDGTVQVWEVDRPEGARRLELGLSPISAVAWSPDGAFLAVGVEREVQIWRAMVPGVAVARYQAQARVLTVAWSPQWSVNGDLEAAQLAWGDEEARVHVWRPGRAEPEMVYREHRSPVGAVAWSPDGAYLASGDEQTVQVWRVADGERVFSTLPSRGKGLPAVGWRPQPRHLWLAVTGFEATVEVWDVLAEEQRWVHTGHAGLGLAVAWSPDGSLLASGGFDQQVQVWRLGWRV